VFPEVAALLVSALICVSALGAVNGLVFTGARISYALGRDHRLFARLGRWHPQLGTPVAALTVQGAIAIGLIACSARSSARCSTRPLRSTLLPGDHHGPDRVATQGAAATARVPRARLPVTPIVFAATCALLIWSAVDYKPRSRSRPRAGAGRPAGVVVGGGIDRSSAEGGPPTGA